jgi:hypothetical protein
MTTVVAKLVLEGLPPEPLEEESNKLQPVTAATRHTEDRRSARGLIGMIGALSIARRSYEVRCGDWLGAQGVSHGAGNRQQATGIDKRQKL